MRYSINSGFDWVRIRSGFDPLIKIETLWWREGSFHIKLYHRWVHNFPHTSRGGLTISRRVLNQED